MRLFAWLADIRKRQSHLQFLVEQLVESCVTQVSSRLSQHVHRLSRHELRGYIRARAVMVVDQALTGLLQSGQVQARTVHQWRSEVLDATTRLVQARVETQTWRTGIRRAA